MGVVVRIEAWMPAAANPAKVFRAVFDRIGELSHRLSSYREDSELRILERRSWREPVPVSPSLGRVLDMALQLARETEGAFDPTLGRVTRLARSSYGKPRGPDEETLRLAWKQVGWRLAVMNTEAQTVFLRRRGVQFDLGGIAKGFIADEAMRVLRSADISRALVAIAGDIVAGDPPPREPGWTVGLDAVGPRGSTERRIVLRRQAVSTSGSREKRWVLNGRECSHVVTLSPGLCSDPAAAVSVVAPTGAQADGLATALVAAGRGRSDEILRGRSDVRAYWASN